MSFLNLKAFIVANNCLYDVNEKFLEAGKYFFIINSFTDNKNVIGNVIINEKNSQYEFRFFTLLNMMVRAQSYLSHRLNESSLSSTLDLREKYMPNFPSPKKTNRKKLEHIENMNKPYECLICLNESTGYDFDLRKLPCGHQYHIKCINEWLENNSTCPTCREEIN